MSRILVVDDESAIRWTLRDLLASCGHEVVEAFDGQDGLEKALAEPFDLVVSDISMPRLSGIELLKQLETACPLTHRVLLTAHSLEEYIDLLVGNNLSCVLTKSVPFPVDELLSTVDALLTRQIFGIERHLSEVLSRSKMTIQNHHEMVHACDSLSEVASSRRRHHLLTVLNEMVTNAIYYGAMNLPGDQKETWHHDFQIPLEMAVEVELAEGPDRKVISILDHGGRLERKTVLHWLHRQMSQDQNGLPLGIFDNHGRGFFISRTFSDRLSISIERGKRCEITMVLYNDSPPLGEKPLVILEI
ncbi:MAG: response regulator [Fibrobacterota bacterium]|nr:response regulator [Fibrobacterota bacterium]QQS05046.1 MAG: response regulator [Fibrobacterota bacterium]